MVGVSAGSEVWSGGVKSRPLMRVNRQYHVIKETDHSHSAAIRLS